MIIEYRKKTKLGKRRLRYFIFEEEGINIPESTIGKVIKRNNLQRKKRKRVKRSPDWSMLITRTFGYEKKDNDVLLCRKRQ